MNKLHLTRACRPNTSRPSECRPRRRGADIPGYGYFIESPFAQRRRAECRHNPKLGSLRPGQKPAYLERRL